MIDLSHFNRNEGLVCLVLSDFRQPKPNQIVVTASILIKEGPQGLP